MATISQSYKYASLETFSELNLYFVQTKESSINLWYLKYLKDNTYVISREAKLKFSNEKEKYADAVLDCLQFAGLLKRRLIHTMNIIDALITEHNKKSIVQTSRTAEEASPLFSQIIKPIIIKLTESKRCKEMHKLGPDSFLEESVYDN